MFSKTCEYAIRATIYIANKSKEGTNVGLKDIAKNIDSPEAFTAKILQKLVKDDLVSSIKGPNGGFSLSKKQQEKVYLIDVVRCIDGSQTYDGCGLGLSQCSEEKPCPIHFQFKEVRTKLKRMLENTNMVILLEKLERGETFLRL
ncbi:Rrf2 family transcriptional regulator [Marivirga salinae]|jgi:Rrf2 family protein|uniref:Rrf2 family transcriptional regulator n=1 Tax=Marivirga salinarum TaxID=3059078 RepID=A0AA51NBV1_9BACT|nr:Rrf2 family transcriptional regulator [Marivirga sp. BDSF4-3]WMN12502.1 Rrf2 family transcriptional regulator [Marivirga sp. BDSF4-3]|tara:strand:+ start:1133 stop:1567 length:435 start_codon:yes stop_codon:yes gene_type:complete